jgi:excisionase family DNA binding protein
MADRPILDRRGTVDLAGAADYYSCSERHVRRMIASGELAAFRVGKRLLRIRVDDLDAALRRIPSGGAA